jgi:hypothetical protein
MLAAQTISPPAPSRTTRSTQSEPYINSAGDLVIPFDAPAKFHWWKMGGQSLAQTRYEIKKPEPISCTLIPTNRIHPIAHELAVYFIGRGPPSCPSCDCPTEREELTPILQRHRCLECGNKFLIEEK